MSERVVANLNDPASCDAADEPRASALAASRLRVRRRPHRRCGVALLEVVVALSILLLAMSVVGLSFRNISRSIEDAERISRARIMTERLIVEMDTGILEMDEREMSGWFGEESIPGMSWRVEIIPHDRIERLVEVDIHIYLGDPDGDEEERLRLLSTRVWRPEPRGLDLEEDFGLDQDQIEQLTEAIPGGAAIFDPTDFDPRMIAQLDMEMLAELLPTLIQAFGANFMGGDLSSLLGSLESGDLGALRGAAEQIGGAAGDLGIPVGGANGGSTGGAGRGGGGRSGRGGGTRQGLGQRSGGKGS